MPFCLPQPFASLLPSSWQGLQVPVSWLQLRLSCHLLLFASRRVPFVFSPLELIWVHQALISFYLKLLTSLLLLLSSSFQLLLPVLTSCLLQPSVWHLRVLSSFTQVRPSFFRLLSLSSLLLFIFSLLLLSFSSLLTLTFYLQVLSSFVPIIITSSQPLPTSFTLFLPFLFEF